MEAQTIHENDVFGCWDLEGFETGVRWAGWSAPGGTATVSRFFCVGPFSTRHGILLLSSNAVQLSFLTGKMRMLASGRACLRGFSCAARIAAEACCLCLARHLGTRSVRSGASGVWRLSETVCKLDPCRSDVHARPLQASALSTTCLGQRDNPTCCIQAAMLRGSSVHGSSATERVPAQQHASASTAATRCAGLAC